jgi:hypothetical protein
MEKIKKSMLKSICACGEMVSVAILFIAIALLAVGLGHFVTWIEHLGASPVTAGLLTFTEYALLVLDIAALLKRVWHHLTAD